MARNMCMLTYAMQLVNSLGFKIAMHCSLDYCQINNDTVEVFKMKIHSQKQCSTSHVPSRYRNAHSVSMISLQGLSNLNIYPQMFSKHLSMPCLVITQKLITIALKKKSVIDYC